MKAIGTRVGAWSYKENIAWLAKAKPCQVYVDSIAESSPAKFDGDPSAFIESKGKDSDVALQLRNKVRKCKVCNKPNAFTLANCNSCSNSLKDVEVSFTNNVFSSFVFGIARGPFPFTISIRQQTPDFLVLDDLLALTRCHMNVVPTRYYLSDWTGLLRSPERGFSLAKEMFEQCMESTMKLFYPHRRHLWRDGDQLNESDLRSLALSGFNYPPSQYQLHLQFMIPPFMPFQWLACLKGVHFTRGRFFPLPYVLDVLQCSSHYKWPEDGNGNIEDLIAFYRDHHNLSYDKAMDAFDKKYADAHSRLANWQQSDFEGVVSGTKFIPFKAGVEGELDEDAAVAIDNVDALAAADKLCLQNYGRPYDAAGKPSGTYYKYAREKMEAF